MSLLCDLPCTFVAELYMFLTDETFVQSRASMLDHQQTEELTKYSLDADGNKTGKPITNALCKGPNYVPQSAIALRSRVMPPPCLKNPYLKDAVEMDVDPFGSWRTKCSGFPFITFFV